MNAYKKILVFFFVFLFLLWIILAIFADDINKICKSIKIIVMAKQIRTFLLCGVGVISIILSIKCFSFDRLDSESRSMYGGDAYTGIQNAAATTSKNVSELASIVQFGFGSLLLINGLTLLAFGLTSPIEKKVKENNGEDVTVIKSEPETTGNKSELNQNKEESTE